MLKLVRVGIKMAPLEMFFPIRLRYYGGITGQVRHTNALVNELKPLKGKRVDKTQ